MRRSTWQGYLQYGREQKTKLCTGAGMELPLHTCKGSALLGDGHSVVRKDERFFPLVEEWRGPGDLASTSQNFIADMEVVDPDDERTGRLSLLGFCTEGVVGSVKQRRLIQLQNVP